MQASARPLPPASAASSPSTAPQFLATSMLPDLVDGRPSKSTHLQRIVLAVVGLLTGNSASVTLARLVEQWPAWVPMPQRRVLLRTLQRLVERQVVELVAGRGYRVNRELAGAAAARGARFRFLPSDFDGSLKPAEVDALALLRGMRSARGHSAGHLGELLGRDRRTVGVAIAGLQRKGRLQAVGETRLRRGNTVPVLVVAEPPASAPGATEAGARSPGRCARSSHRRARSSHTLDSARPADSTRLDHPAPSIESAPVEPIQSAAPSGGDDPIRPPAEQQQQPAAVLAMPTLAAIEADEAAGRAALNSWSVWRKNLRQAVEVVQRPVSGDLAGYAAAWFAVLTLAGVFVPARRWRGRGPTTLRQRRRDLAERLAREQGHPTIGATWLYAMARRVEADGKPPSAIASALVASVTPKDREQLAGTRNPAGVELGQFIKPQGGHDAKHLPQQWEDEAMSDADRERAEAAKQLVDGVAAVSNARERAGELGAARIRERLRELEAEGNSQLAQLAAFLSGGGAACAG